MNESLTVRHRALCHAGHGSCKRWGPGAPLHPCRSVSGSDPTSAPLLLHEAHPPDHHLTTRGCCQVHSWERRPSPESCPELLRATHQLP